MARALVATQGAPGERLTTGGARRFSGRIQGSIAWAPVRSGLAATQAASGFAARQRLA